MPTLFLPSYGDIQIFAPYPQYVIAFTILIVIACSPGRPREFSWSRVLGWTFVMWLAVLSNLNGLVQGLSPNWKAIIITSILAWLDFARPNRTVLQHLFWFVLSLLVLEYILAYSGVYLGHLWRFSRIRPFGIFLDLHVLSFFVVFALLGFGRKYLAVLSGFIMGTTQSVLQLIVAMVRRVKPWMVIVLAAVLLGHLGSIGHLSVSRNLGKGSDSMLNVLWHGFRFDGQRECFAFGCGIDVTQREEQYGLSIDIGIVRIIYQFGIIWTVAVLTLLYRKYDFLLVSALFVVPLLHYPITFGILGSILAMLFLKSL